MEHNLDLTEKLESNNLEWVWQGQGSRWLLQLLQCLQLSLGEGKHSDPTAGEPLGAPEKVGLAGGWGSSENLVGVEVGPELGSEMGGC